MVTIKKKAYARKSSGARKPDQEIMALVHNVSEFAAARKKTIRIAALVLAAVLIVFSGSLLKKSYDEQKAAALLAAAFDRYSRSTGANSDYTNSLELFGDIQKKYPATTSGSIAAYYHANSLMNMGRNDEALKEYNSFINSYDDPFLLGLVYTRMGYLYKGQGKQEDAVKAFERAESLSGPGVATFELARLYEAAGNQAASEKKYKVIAEKLPGTSWAMEAMGKVGKGGHLPGTAAVQEKAGQEKTK